MYVESVCMCKECWCVGLEQEGGCLCEGERNCLKYLRRRWNRRGRENKNFKVSFYSNGNKFEREIQLILVMIPEIH